MMKKIELIKKYDNNSQRQSDIKQYFIFNLKLKLKCFNIK